MSNEATLSAPAEQELHIPCSSRDASIPLPRLEASAACLDNRFNLQQQIARQSDQLGRRYARNLHLPVTWRIFAMANQQPAYRAFTVIKRGEGQDDYWLPIGVPAPVRRRIQRDPTSAPDSGSRWPMQARTPSSQGR
jgi:hypothetical protein